ncbi:MAG: hypothetical protein JSU70_23295 [Phycisphaerales bacterium]|nr:MAG: hypothetical protein JSU70_23295 [Phycisphaerales bacterium]
MERSGFVLVLGLLLLGNPAAYAVTAGEPAVKTSPSPSEDSARSPLYMLTYDHGGLVLWGREHFEEHLSEATLWLDRYPSFKIGLDNEAYTYDQLATEYPATLEKIRRCLKAYSGRFGIGTCTYGQPLSVFINEESNIRQIGYALEADRKHLGCAPSVYLMSEHAMHSQIPQILNGFGFGGAIMRTHYMMYGYNPTFDAAIGWWVGLDGSRIPTIPTYTGQGAQFGRTTVDNWILTRYPGDNAPKSPADFRREFAHIRPLLASRADDAGLRKEALVKEYEGRPGYKWILLEEVFSTFPSPEKELLTRPNDFVVRMPWGYCGNEIWNASRQAEVAVLTAERLAAIEHSVGGEDRNPRLVEAWKNLLIAQHHDIQICGLLHDAREFLAKSLGISRGVIDASLRHAASMMSPGDHQQVVFFNPVSWRRREWVKVPISLPRGYAKGLEVHHGDRVLPSAILSADLHSDGSLRDIDLAVSADLPGLSVASFRLVPAGKSRPARNEALLIDSEILTIVSPHLSIRFDPKGGLSSITDRRTNKELTRAGKRSGFLAGKIEGVDTESSGRWVLRRGQGGAPWAVATENGFVADIPYTLQMKVYRDVPRIDCWVRLRFAGQRIGRISTNVRDFISGFVHEDKLRFKLFPALNEDGTTGVRDLPFAVSETRNRYIDGLYFSALTGGESGIALFNRGTMGTVREKDGGFSMPLAYAMYYVWGTRMLSGDFEYEFAIYPFTGRWQKADLHRRAIEYNYQPVGLFAAAGVGALGHTIRPVTVAPADVVVSALYNTEDDLYLRFYEHEGNSRQVSITSTTDDVGLTEVDLAGREMGAVSGPLSFSPWQIKTVRIRKEGH